MIYCGVGAELGFVPPTEEFRRLAKEMRPIFDPRCSVCAEIDGRPVACGLPFRTSIRFEGHRRPAVPARFIRLLRRKTIIDQARLLSGVLAGYREHGLYPLLPVRSSIASSPDRAIAASSSRGCSRTTAISTSLPNRQAPGATRPTACIRRRSREPARRPDGRNRIHRTPPVGASGRSGIRGDRGGATGVAAHGSRGSGGRPRAAGRGGVARGLQSSVVVHLAGIVNALDSGDAGGQRRRNAGRC